ncbi:MAG: fibronectin type III protein [uncultured bacterium]|nr:MAG: fibronectin type III protein [uncultured bacterium]
MQAALEGKNDEGFQKPSNVNAIQIDAFGGGLPCPGYPVRSEYFVKGTEPTKDCAVEKKLNGQDYYVFVEFDPVSTDGVNRWQKGIDAWEAGQGDPKYHPPGELLSQPNQNPDDIGVSVTSPGDHNQVDYHFETKATISTGRKITKVEFYVDDTLKDSTNSSDSNAKFDFTFASANQGKHKLRVKAYNEAGKLGEKEITVSVGVPWTD